MERLILFATQVEAAPTLKRLNALPTPEPHCYTFSGGRIIITGIGMHAALFHLVRYGAQATEILNIGIAGALSQSYPLGSLLPVHRVGRYAHLPENLDPLSQQFFTHHSPDITLASVEPTTSISLISSDFPLYLESVRHSLSSQWNLVDMEGYGIAYSALHLKKRALLWKIVSDFADVEGRGSLRKQLPSLSEKIADFYQHYLEMGSTTPC